MHIVKTQGFRRYEDVYEVKKKLTTATTFYFIQRTGEANDFPWVLITWRTK